MTVSVNVNTNLLIEQFLHEIVQEPLHLFDGGYCQLGLDVWLQLHRTSARRGMRRRRRC
jgi:hypothetical protein